MTSADRLKAALREYPADEAFADDLEEASAEICATPLPCRTRMVTEEAPLLL
jgi:hypothetical protein